jgi:signal transduction histidine kinase
LKEEIVDLKNRINDFIKKNKFINFVKQKTSTVTAQLTIGIAAIVFITTLMIGLIFLSQYRQLSLKQTEQDLSEKSTQLAELGHLILTSPMPISRDRLFNSIKGITNSDFWIISNTGEVVVSTTNSYIINSVSDINDKFLDNIKSDKSIITYDYSEYFNTKTLSVITPIIDRNMLIGAVILHRDVNIIYQGNTSFTILVFISLVISLALSIGLGTVYSAHFTKPLKRVTEVASEIAKQNYDIKTGIEREDEIGELASTIDMMSSKISKNIDDIKALEGRAKELVANVSHEFKTPLTLIRGYVENLEDHTTKPSSEVYNKIINNTIILEKLVNELLDLSKLQSGKTVLKKESLELKQLLNDVVSDMKNIAKEKKIKIKLKEVYNESQIIEADYIKIRQLITIFVDNAIKYSNIGGLVEITILKGEIIISDNGIGIDQSKLEQLFERYYQVDHNEKGYGLGLCIAKYIADAHNYKLVVDSVPNKGTNIHVIF